MSGFSDHAFFLDFCVSRISFSIIRFIVNSGPRSCTARLGAPVRAAQEIANFGLESCAVLTEFQPPWALGPNLCGPHRKWAHFCAGRTGSGTMSYRTGNELKSCENYLFTNWPIGVIISIVNVSDTSLK